jgi:uncharacterized RDD family membrane protein YckC
MEKTSNSLGAIYEKEAYAGLIKRVVIVVVDMIVLILSEFLVIYASDNFIYNWDAFYWFNFFASLFLTLSYLAILKRSRIGTVGYMITGVKIVDIKGRRPSILRMLLRTMLLIIGPFELVFDIIWLTSEKTKQTLRDKYVGTYVVNKSSSPKAYGKLRHVILDVMGWNLRFLEVEDSEVL